MSYFKEIFQDIIDESKITVSEEIEESKNILDEKEKIILNRKSLSILTLGKYKSPGGMIFEIKNIMIEIKGMSHIGKLFVKYKIRSDKPDSQVWMTVPEFINTILEY